MSLASVAVIVMAKYPAAGKVKTRLLPALTPDEAASLQRVFLRHVVRRVAALAPAELVVCFDPPEARQAMADLLADLPPPLTLLEQSAGDLGDRLAMAARMVGRHGRLLFLGVDSPDVPNENLRTAATMTGEADVSLAPTTDGGFWSLGLRSAVDAVALLHAIPWSSGKEATAMLDRARSLGYSTATGGAWDDVDRPDDLATLIRRLSRSTGEADRSLLSELRVAVPAFVQSFTADGAMNHG